MKGGGSPDDPSSYVYYYIDIGEYGPDKENEICWPRNSSGIVVSGSWAFN